MKEDIKQALRFLLLGEVLFWLLPILLLAAGEFEILPVGMLVDNERASYYAETFTILFTAALVPLSLKLFSLVLKRRIDQLTLMRALRLYTRWSLARLLLLEAVVVVGMLCYYATLSSNGWLCALIAVTASLFCLPSEKRLRRDLHIDKDA